MDDDGKQRRIVIGMIVVAVLLFLVLLYTLTAGGDTSEQVLTPTGPTTSQSSSPSGEGSGAGAAGDPSVGPSEPSGAVSADSIQLPVAAVDYFALNGYPGEKLDCLAQTLIDETNEQLVKEFIVAPYNENPEVNEALSSGRVTSTCGLETFNLSVGANNGPNSDAQVGDEGF